MAEKSIISAIYRAVDQYEQEQVARASPDEGRVRVAPVGHADNRADDHVRREISDLRDRVRDGEAMIRSTR